MAYKVIRHGTHVINNDHDGYTYSFNVSKSYSFDSHLHKCYEIIHVIKGQLIYTVEGRDYFISDGDIVMTSPDEFHSFSFPHECEYVREFLHIYPGFIENVPETAKMLNSRAAGCFNHIPCNKVKKYGLDSIFEEIRQTCAEPSFETNTMVLAGAMLIASKVCRMLADDAPQYTAPALNSKTNSICGYIDLHYMEDITVESIAAEMLMSPSGARRIFKSETGMSIKSYLTLRRITAAKNKIMEGKKAMSIFESCGFHDYSTFYRSFLKYVGMTPDAFKHRHDDRIKK